MMLKMLLSLSLSFKLSLSMFSFVLSFFLSFSLSWLRAIQMVPELTPLGAPSYCWPTLLTQPHLRQYLSSNCFSHEKLSSGM